MAKKTVPKNIRVLADGRWQIRLTYTDPGGRRREIVEMLPDTSVKAATQRIAALRTGLVGLRHDVEPDRPLTFREVADRYADLELRPAVFENGRKISGRLSRSADGALRVLRVYFGSTPIGSISVADLQRFKLDRLATPVRRMVKIKRALSPAERAAMPARSRRRFEMIRITRETPRSIRSVNYELSLLRTVLAFAAREGWVLRSPFAAARKIIDVTAESRRHVNWTPEEESAALTLCTGQRAHLKAVIICIVDGGFRRSELLKARWDEIDWDEGVMLAKSHKRTALHVRPVWLTDRMREALLEWRELQASFKLNNGLRPDRSRVIGFNDVKHAWQEVRAAIGRPDLRLHDLRHVYATRLAGASVPLADIAALLGHSSITTTERYINAQNRHLAAHARRLATRS